MEPSCNNVATRNVSYALQEKLAFSAYVPRSTELHYNEPEANEAAGSAGVAAAREQLQLLAQQRLRELQLLTELPLFVHSRMPVQVDKLQQQAESDVAWQAVSTRESPFVQLPSMPDVIRRDLYSPLDLLMALAGQLPKEHELSTAAALPAPAATIASHPHSRTNSLHNYPTLLKSTAQVQQQLKQQLPRCLGLVTFLPATKGLPSPSLAWLQSFFADLKPQQRHVGVDDRKAAWFRDLKVQAATTIVQDGTISVARSFAKFGVPHGLRGRIWECALGLGPLSAADVSHVDGLCRMVQQQHTTVLDAAVCGDVQSVVDSEHYFLFEEMLRAVMLAFLRDSEIAQHCSVAPQPQLSLQPGVGADSKTSNVHGTKPTILNGNQGKLAFQHSTVGPGTDMQPAGGTAVAAAAAAAATADGTVPQAASGAAPCLAWSAAAADTPSAAGLPLPMQGLSLLAAPLCYMYEHPAGVYRLFRALYCRHWVKLHALTCHGLPAPSLPMLLKTYEELLQELDPDVVGHIHRLGLPISAVAMPWITSAFVGHVPVEEVLLLWDRIIGLDSLLPVPLLAVAVVCFRRQMLLSCQSSKEVLETMADISQLKTVPLLQAVLFQG